MDTLVEAALRLRIIDGVQYRASDQNMMGITPDCGVEIDSDLPAETDGPVLKHGLQEMHGRTISTSQRSADRPDRELLAWRYEKMAARRG
ncbi:hypothetical protein [Sanguibacter antarcticus]|uniref:hypothetical protein n=1 Tax=Sanguibacter antarcticus TaxID=372484 RepID=UPI000BF2B575|nr:hypothetical protein [Sanguibacter antarcticus]